MDYSQKISERLLSKKAIKKSGEPFLFYGFIIPFFPCKFKNQQERVVRRFYE